MPEVGNMGLPSKLLRRGIKDMVRISDARMSGTAYGTVILHVAPEAAVGGPLALIRDGDMIEINVMRRELNVEVSEETLAQRRKEWTAPEFRMKGGYQQLYRDRVTQADTGVDLDFLKGCRGADVPRESH
jgi:dihydroxy-acid dehydratase